MKNSYIIFILALTILVFISSGSISAQSYRYQTKGFYNLSELHIGYGLQGDVEPNEIGFAGLSTLAGYTSTKRLAAGIGAGFFAYNGSNAVPVYIEGGYYLRNFGIGKMRFFLKADAGVLIRVNGDISPARYYVNPAAGLLIPVASHKELSVSLGWFAQWDPDSQDITQKKQLTNFINAKVGLRIY